MSEDSPDGETEPSVIEEISGIIYHKSKILLKAITRKDKAKWFDQLMIKKPNAEQIRYLDGIVEHFDQLLGEYRSAGQVDEAKIQVIGKMILKAPEMTNQIGKLIAHIFSTLGESDEIIERTLDSSIKKDSHLIAKKQEKAQAMAALEAHLRDDSPEAASKFDSFKHRFQPKNSVINEERGEDQEEASSRTYEFGNPHDNTFKGNYESTSYYDTNQAEEMLLRDPLINPGVEQLDIYNDEDDYDY